MLGRHLCYWSPALLFRCGQLGRHGGTDGRASLLFFFDYSIISGRSGAMEVFISSYLERRLVLVGEVVRLEDIT